MRMPARKGDWNLCLTEVLHSELSLPAHQVHVAEAEIELIAAAREVEALDRVGVEAEVEVQRTHRADLKLDARLRRQFQVAAHEGVRAAGEHAVARLPRGGRRPGGPAAEVSRAVVNRGETLREERERLHAGTRRAELPGEPRLQLDVR